MIYVFEDFELDTALFELRRAGRPRPVEPQVFDVLAYLVAHRDRVVGKDELLETLWGGHIVTESTLSSRIKAARKAVGDSGRDQRLIATVHRRGHRFVGAVEERPSAPAEDEAIAPAAGTAGAGDSAASSPERSAPPGGDAARVDLASLAVIPFAHNPAGARVAWLAESLTEDLSIRLARIPGFLVISRNSTFAYKDRQVALRQIGEELGARYLVQGSLWEAAGRLRVSVQLLEAASGQLLWARREEVAGDDLHEVQDDLVREIVSQLEPEILRAELPDLKRRLPVDLGAWSLYRRAHAIIGMRGWSEETVEEATALLRQAIRQDPELAFAHAYLALVLAIGHLMGLITDGRSQAEARRAAERALAIDSQDSDVLGYAGCALADLGDFARGIGLIERATELDPSNAQARAALGAALLETGRPEGIEYLRQGMRISPRDNRLAVWGALLARGLLRLDRTAEAIDAARAACRCDDKIFLPRIVLAIACAESGALEDAAAAMSDARRIRPRLAHGDFTWMATPENLDTLKSVGLL
jgi:adenylate cyclase